MKRIALILTTLALLVTACDTATPAPSPTAPPPSAAPTAAPAGAPTVAPSATPAGPRVDAPAWPDNAIIYEVFVRSFCDSDDDGIGDLRGLTSRLDYLNDGDPNTDTDLGVDAIWLMPIFASPSYHGYDTTDYYRVNPDYGTNEDLVALVQEAHKRGIRVILDYVAGHTSNLHPFFLDAHHNPASQYTPFYQWLDDQNGSYAGFASLASMPSLNYDSPETVAYMLDMARYWMDLDGDGDYTDGIDGFRCDYAKGPPHAFWKQLRAETKKLNPNFYLLAEVWDSNPQVITPYYDAEFDATFDFVLYFMLGGNETKVGDGVLAGTTKPRFIEIPLKGREKLYPAGAQSVPFISNHDTNRVMSDVQGDMRRAKLGATLLLTLPGTPLIYYGEEIGMPGIKGGGNPYWDEYRREPMDWYAAESGPGMTTWFQPGNRYNKPNDGISLEEQRGVPGSLWEHYHALIALRDEYPVLRAGARIPVATDQDSVYAFLRDNGSERILVVLNFADQKTPVTLTLDDAGSIAGPVRDLLTGESLPAITGASYQLTLEPLTGHVLLIGAP
ncbi:MAG: alpha-glucosidase C-terminal domain-containing protein [Chloroflexi bacterium]|nr:alpha-glucosidase C-terminal domain-containing protein [Chloroflexota bacterium]